MDTISSRGKNVVRRLLIALILLALATAASACNLPRGVLPRPTAKSPQTGRATPVDTAAPTTPVAGGQATSTDFCSQESPRRLIDDLRTALSTEDGALLASLVDPVHGMDVQLIREGPIINYDRAQAMELLGSDAISDWGQSPGSGLALQGSFRSLVLPALLEVLNRNPSYACNHILAGGATFTPAWPYPSVDFYAAFYPGTEANGRLDWRTWLFGMQTAKTRLYLYAMTRLHWEP